MASTFRIHCSASDGHSLVIVNGEVVLAKADPDDDRQVWYKDLSYGDGIKDEARSPAFVLVNKSTGEAIKHSVGLNCAVRAIRPHPLRYVDESVLWAESEDVVHGFRRIHMANNMDYVFDAERAVPGLGGVRHGTRLILFRWNGGRNQLWRITPRPLLHPPEASESEDARRVRILCHSGGEDLSVTVRDGAVVLAPSDTEDERQCWVQSFLNTGHMTDEEGHQPFALVNQATGKALSHRRCGDVKLVQLAGHCPDSVDVALLWTQSDDLGEGFHGLRTVNDVDRVFDALNGDVGGTHDGTPVIVFPWHSGRNQMWMLLPFCY